MLKVCLSFALLLTALQSQGAVKVETFSQKLNWADLSDTRSFHQRFMVDSTFASGDNAPVLFYICGEDNCFGAVPSPFPPLVESEASRLRAHMVTVEHRYFGKSQPFDELTADNLKYLTVENALQDLANVQRTLVVERKLKGKWVVIGGSYAGALSAFYRLKFPELAAGSIASSAPVEAKESLSEFDNFAAHRLGASCSADVRNILKTVSETASDPVRFSVLAARFGISNSVNVAGVMSFFTSVAPFYVQFGLQEPFCIAIHVADPVSAYVDLANRAFAVYGLNPQNVVDGAESIGTEQYEAGVGIRQWTYLQCTQLGFFETSSEDPAWSITLAQYSSLPFAVANCNRLFGKVDLNASERMNSIFYKGLLKPIASQILFTNGTSDPWSNLSISPLRGNNTNPNTSSVVIEGASHCSDLDSVANRAGNSPAMNEALLMIERSLDAWLR